MMTGITEDLKIKRYIFWLDKNIKTPVNQFNLKKLKKKFPSYEIRIFSRVQSFLSFLNKNQKDYNFKLIYFIVSGKLAEEFFEQYTILSHSNITITAATIVFCSNKKLHLSKPYANDSYLNPGGIVTFFKDVINYIEGVDDLWKELLKCNKNDNTNSQEKNENFGNVFKYEESLSGIALPIILTEIMKKNLINEEDILTFEKYIFSRYQNNKNNKEIISLVRPSLEKNIYLPLRKSALYFLRLYTLESDFYKNLNKELTNANSFGFYKAFILILYFSIQNKNFKSYVDGKLYRRTLITEKEMNEIKCHFNKRISNNDNNDKNTDDKISSIIYYSKAFMSFSKEKSETKKFAVNIKPDTVRVTFILEPLKNKDKIFFSNIDIDVMKISKYDKEKEVLFLPLSCFEMKSIEEIGDKEYKITLNYLDKYFGPLKKKISKMEKEKELQDFYEEILESSFSKKLVENIKNPEAIYNNIKDFLIDHSLLPDIDLNFNKIITKYPHNKLMPRFNENASMEGISSGFSNGKQLNALYSSEPTSIQLQENKYSGYKILELKYEDGSKAIIKKHPEKGNNIIIKKIDENGNLGYYDEAFKPITEEIKVKNVNTQEVLTYSEGLTMEKINELSLLRNGYANANLLGGIIGYNLANIDNFMKSSGKDKIKILGETSVFSGGIYLISNAYKSAVPMISTGITGICYFYDVASTICSPALTKKDTAISILKNTTNLAVNIFTGIGGFYSGLEIGISFGITTGPGAILIGIGSGMVGGLIGGIFGRLLNSKMVLNCNSFYKNYIPLKFRKSGNIPDLFWDGVNKNTKSFAIELIIDQKYKTWSVINIPPQTRKITANIGETLIKYQDFMNYNPSKVDFILYSLNKKKITKEDWEDQKNNNKLIKEVAILEVDNL